MGFIPQTNTKTLYAYLTPKGRQYILDGDKEEFQVAFFSLHDDDVNYLISSNISAGTTSTYYTLQSGFIPDITGDNDSCIKSIAKGTSVNMLSTLSGSTIIDPATGFLTVGPLGNSGIIGGRYTTISGPSNTTINDGPLTPSRPSYNIQFNVSLTAPAGDTVALTPSEIENSKFYVKIINPSPSNLINNFKISGIPISVNTDFLYTPTSPSQLVNIQYSLATSPSTTQTIAFKIVITPFNANNIINNSTISYTATYPVDRGGGTDEGGGSGTSFSGPPIAAG